MRIYELYDNINTILPLQVPDYIQSTEWYGQITEYFDGLLLQRKGEYEINLPRLKGNYKDISLVVKNISDIIRLHLVSHFYEYNGLYDTTKLEYNPIWNVDGTTTIEHDGVTDTSSSGENKHIGLDKLEKTGSDTYKHIGSDTDTHSGFDSVASSGVDTTQKEQVTSETPMDSNTFLNKQKIVDEDNITYGKKDITDYNNQLTSEYDSQNVNEYGGIDTTTYNSTNNHSDVSEQQSQFTEVTVRQGNQGITSTQHLIGEERDIVNFSFLEYVVNDITPRFTLTGGIDTLWI